MSDALANLLDLNLGWTRARHDQPERVFVRHPFEINLVEVDVEGWLRHLDEDIRGDHYNPSPMVVCEVPKGKGAVRPAGDLNINDRIVYAACVGACFPFVHEHLSIEGVAVDFSYRLADNPDEANWLKPQFGGWTDFRNSSLATLADGMSYVVIADISAYYENIDLATLASDLRQIGCPEVAIAELGRCLNRWAQVPGRGIPQGHSPSDILGKLYLRSVDCNLREMGYLHYRYVDDYRVFCKDLVEAKRALVDLTRLLRKRGLNFQAAKSEIHRGDKAKSIIEGVTTTIDTVRHKFISRMAVFFGEDYNAMSMGDFEMMLAAHGDDPNDAPIEVIQETYKTYFIDSDDSNFDKSLFRFLLGRLGRQADKFAVEHCKTLFEKHPEENLTILKYFEAADSLEDVEDTLVLFLNSADAVYPYQIYQILEWLNRVSDHPSDDLIGFARRATFEPASLSYVRAVAREFIALHGTAADLERLEHSYADAQGSLEQSEVICSLRRMELNRRNAFLRRAEGDGELNLRAARLTRAA